MVRFLSAFSILFLVGGLSACQTTRLNTADAHFFKAIIGEHCIIDFSVGGHGPRLKRAMESITVMNIVGSDQGWQKVDYATTGLRYNFYYQKEKGKAYCSSAEWQKSGLDVTFDS